MEQKTGRHPNNVNKAKRKGGHGQSGVSVSLVDKRNVKEKKCERNEKHITVALTQKSGKK